MLVRSKSFSLALDGKGRHSLRGRPDSFFQGLFEGLQSCKSLGLIKDTRGEGLKGGLRALSNAISNAGCCILVAPRPSIRGQTSQRCPPS